MSKPLARRPPAGVRRQLRREVGFGCPVDGCDVPYLEYHHFDPPWAVKQHHNPQGMIALCATHHAKAGAWTTSQMRQLKRSAMRRPVHGRFEWMRRDVLAVAGSNFYYETPIIVALRGEPVIWFERDFERRLLLNLRMPSVSGQPRTRIENNDWIMEGEPLDFESPPSGSSISVCYENGDSLKVAFKEWRDEEELFGHHAVASGLRQVLRFPLVTANIHMTIGGTDFRLTPQESTFGGVQIRESVISHCQIGVSI